MILIALLYQITKCIFRLFRSILMKKQCCNVWPRSYSKNGIYNPLFKRKPERKVNQFSFFTVNEPIVTLSLLIFLAKWNFVSKYVRTKL